MLLQVKDGAVSLELLQKAALPVHLEAIPMQDAAQRQPLARQMTASDLLSALLQYSEDEEFNANNWKRHLLRAFVK